MRIVIPKQRISHRGFALIEVLTAILVISFGLIGLAGLGVVGLRNNHVSYLRSIATQQAYDMADRIRANSGGSYTNITSSIPTGPFPCITATTGCDAPSMVTYDQFAWNTANAALLPSGSGTVGFTNNQFVITVNWVEKCTVGEATCGANGTSNQSFVTYFAL